MAEMTWEEFEAIKARLTPEQVERIKEKCQWEHCSWLAVYENWPSLFADEQEGE